jgi:hypothetical protein
MQTFNDKQIEAFINKILNTIKSKNNNASLYFIALLFAIALKITWLIIVFAVFFTICIFIYFNNKFNFINIKTIKSK